uniref:Uncharacterized protein n=1 Tax=Schistocephalus solidus TaxID=70667 RepID=A0A0X3Q145_SCHSO
MLQVRCTDCTETACTDRSSVPGMAQVTHKIRPKWFRRVFRSRPLEFSVAAWNSVSLFKGRCRRGEFLKVVSGTVDHVMEEILGPLAYYFRLYIRVGRALEKICSRS